MRGSPLLRALLTLLVLALVAWPIWRVTSAVTPRAPARDHRTAAAATSRLVIAFLPVPPIEFEVRYLGQPVWRGGGKTSEESGPLAIAFPPEGIDLQIRARWADDVPSAAVRVQLVAPDGAVFERLAWTHDQPFLDDVLTFSPR